jgi:hypothetical protein
MPWKDIFEDACAIAFSVIVVALIASSFPKYFTMTALDAFTAWKYMVAGVFYVRYCDYMGYSFGGLGKDRK